jgi:hypothetical protein
MCLIFKSCNMMCCFFCDLDLSIKLVLRFAIYVSLKNTQWVNYCSTIAIFYTLFIQIVSLYTPSSLKISWFSSWHVEINELENWPM